MSFLLPPPPSPCLPLVPEQASCTKNNRQATSKPICSMQLNILTSHLCGVKLQHYSASSVQNIAIYKCLAEQLNTQKILVTLLCLSSGTHTCAP